MSCCIIVVLVDVDKCDDPIWLNVFSLPAESNRNCFRNIIWQPFALLRGGLVGKTAYIINFQLYSHFFFHKKHLQNDVKYSTLVSLDQKLS